MVTVGHGRTRIPTEIFTVNRPLAIVKLTLEVSSVVLITTQREFYHLHGEVNQTDFGQSH